MIKSSLIYKCSFKNHFQTVWDVHIVKCLPPSLMYYLFEQLHVISPGVHIQNVEPKYSCIYGIGGGGTTTLPISDPERPRRSTSCPTCKRVLQMALPCCSMHTIKAAIMPPSVILKNSALFGIVQNDDIYDSGCTAELWLDHTKEAIKHVELQKLL